MQHFWKWKQEYKVISRSLQKIFKDESKEEVEEIVEKTLEMYFEKINSFYKIVHGSIIKT